MFNYFYDENQWAKSMQEIKVLILLKIVLLIFVNTDNLYAQNDHTVYLIGDAGEDKKPGKTLLMLQKYLEKDSNSTVIFLGDNAYPSGINHIDLSKISTPYLHPKAATLYSQLSILKKYKGNVFFIPGNHDWKAQKKHQAFESLKNESIAIESYLKDSTEVKNEKSINFLPVIHNKQLKPEAIDINEKLSILFFDSQWFFQKIKGINRNEKKEIMKTFFHALDSLIVNKQNEGRKIIIASHHPVQTNGYHAKKRQPLRFIFNWTPFWLLGILGVDRWLSQDIHQPFYKSYRKEFEAILQKHHDLIIASGHDHNLQLFNTNENIHIVSGAGSKIKKLKRKNIFDSVYQTDKKKGFVKFSFNESQVLKISFISEEDEILFEQ